MGILRSTAHEAVAGLLAKGHTKAEAKKAAGFSTKSHVCSRPDIKARVKELQQAGEEKAINFCAMKRSEIIQRFGEDWELARKLGQISAGLKAGELIGRELHKMFVDRKEIGAPGDFDNKSLEELEKFIRDELSDLGVDLTKTMKDITPPAKAVKTETSNGETLN